MDSGTQLWLASMIGFSENDIFVVDSWGAYTIMMGMIGPLK